MLEPSN